MTDNEEVPSVVYLHALPSELLQGFQKPQMVVLVKHLCSRNAVFGAECGLDTLNDSLSLTDWRNSLLNAHRRALVRAQTAIVDDENDNDEVNAELGDTLPVLDFTFVLDLLNAHPDKALVSSVVSSGRLSSVSVFASKFTREIKNNNFLKPSSPPSSIPMSVTSPVADVNRQLATELERAAASQAGSSSSSSAKQANATSPPGRAALAPTPAGGFAGALAATLQRPTLLTAGQQAHVRQVAEQHQWQRLCRHRPVLGEKARVVVEAVKPLLAVPAIDFVAAKAPDAGTRIRSQEHAEAVQRAAVFHLLKAALPRAMNADAVELLDVLEQLLLFDVDSVSFDRYNFDLLSAEQRRFDQLPPEHVTTDEELMAQLDRTRELAARFAPPRGNKSGGGAAGKASQGAGGGAIKKGAGGRGKKGKGKQTKQSAKEGVSAGGGKDGGGASRANTTSSSHSQQ